MQYAHLYTAYLFARRDLERAKGTEDEPVARAVLQRAIDRLSSFARKHPGRH